MSRWASVVPSAVAAALNEDRLPGPRAAKDADATQLGALGHHYATRPATTAPRARRCTRDGRRTMVSAASASWIMTGKGHRGQREERSGGKASWYARMFAPVLAPGSRAVAPTEIKDSREDGHAECAADLAHGVEERRGRPVLAGEILGMRPLGVGTKTCPIMRPRMNMTRRMSHKLVVRVSWVSTSMVAVNPINPPVMCRLVRSSGR